MIFSYIFSGHTKINWLRLYFQMPESLPCLFGECSIILCAAFWTILVYQLSGTIRSFNIFAASGAELWTRIGSISKSNPYLIEWTCVTSKCCRYVSVNKPSALIRVSTCLKMSTSCCSAAICFLCFRMATRRARNNRAVFLNGDTSMLPLPFLSVSSLASSRELDCMKIDELLLDTSARFRCREVVI